MPQPTETSTQERRAARRQRRLKSRTLRLSAASLLLGIAALGLIFIPNLAFDEPLVWPWQEKPTRIEPPPPPQGGVTVGTERFRVTIGRNRPTTTPVVPPPPKASPVKPYHLAAMVLALAGLGLAPLAWTLEKHRPLAASAAAICCAALAWQYILAAIFVAVAIALLLMLLSALS